MSKWVIVSGRSWYENTCECEWWKALEVSYVISYNLTLASKAQITVDTLKKFCTIGIAKCLFDEKVISLVFSILL